MSLMIVAHDEMTTSTMESALIKLFPGLEVVRSEFQAGLPVCKVGSDRIRVIIIDLRSIADPDEVISHLVLQFPGARMLAVIRSGCDESQRMALSLRSAYGRPHGVVPSSVGLEILAAAVQLVAEGGEIVLWDRSANERTSWKDTERALDGLNGTMERNGSTLPSPHVWKNLSARYQLTTREEEVLALLKTGMQNKLIAARMGRSENTIRVHIQNILRKLSARNRTEAVNKFYGPISRSQRSI
jgi:DNA-binding NarL/FixJ family response regulator